MPKRSAFDVLGTQGSKKLFVPKREEQGWVELGQDCTIGYFPRHLDKSLSDASFQVHSDLQHYKPLLCV